MAEEDFEIEYLDEDEDIVHQYTQPQAVPLPIKEEAVETDDDDDDIEKKLTPLLIERKPAETKRKPKIEEVDSDYDPQEDLVALRIEKNKLMAQKKKRRQQPPRRAAKTTVTPKKPVVEPVVYSSRRKPDLRTPDQSKPLPEIKVVIEKEVDDLKKRKKLNINIPDYEDPLCMSVTAHQENEEDMKKLKRWNRVCLEQFKKCDKVFAPDTGTAVKSSRTVVLRNVQNRISGDKEMTIWSKTIVENEKGETKSDIFQYVLPRFQEKNPLELFPMYKDGSKQTRKHTFEAMLMKEQHKDGEVLVVYKPKEATSAVYKLLEKPASDDSERVKLSMKELTCCKICAPCYQSSWRGARKIEQANITCQLCGRSHVSVYNLLSHLKSHHSNRDVNRHRDKIAKLLASLVEYHYTCRICREQFSSIKQLRKHINKHQGTEEFRCDIGNHLTT